MARIKKSTKGEAAADQAQEAHAPGEEVSPQLAKAEYAQPAAADDGGKRRSKSKKRKQDVTEEEGGEEPVQV